MFFSHIEGCLTRFYRAMSENRDDRYLAISTTKEGGLACRELQ
jgi:hypothetical protein